MDPETIRAAAELAKAVPVEAWRPTAEAASRIVEQFLAPVTATTSGIAELIRARFERLTSLERINTAAMLDRARVKIEESEKPIIDVDAKVVVSTLENAALESDPELQESWANLLAQQFVSGRVHPLIPRILSQMSGDDGRMLAEIERLSRGLALKKGKDLAQRKHLGFSMRNMNTLSASALVALGLVRNGDGGFWLTQLGWEFLNAAKPVARRAHVPIECQ